MRKGGILNWLICMLHGHWYVQVATREDYGSVRDGYHASLGSNEPLYTWHEMECIYCGKRKYVRGAEVR